MRSFEWQSTLITHLNAETLDFDVSITNLVTH